MSHSGSRREFSNPIMFLAVTGFACYLIYFAFSVSYEVGVEKGQRLAPFKPPPPAPTEPARVFDLRKLRQPTPELVAMGAQVYLANCQSCHGEQGFGDGAAGQRLVVKPKNFHGTTVWKNGPQPLKMYESLAKGVGGNMPAFPTLNPEQKFAVIHYVRQWVPNAPDDDPQAIASLPAPQAVAGGPPTLEEPAARVGLAFAADLYIDRVPQPQPMQASMTAPDADLLARGARLYLKNCASCHGAKGQGGVEYKSLNTGVAANIGYPAHPERPVQPARLELPPLWKPMLDWTTNRETFDAVVTRGLEGRLKPGFATLTRAELDALHAYAVSLAANPTTGGADDVH